MSDGAGCLYQVVIFLFGTINPNGDSEFSLCLLVMKEKGVYKCGNLDSQTDE